MFMKLTFVKAGAVVPSYESIKQRAKIPESNLFHHREKKGGKKQFHIVVSKKRLKFKKRNC